MSFIFEALKTIRQNTLEAVSALSTTQLHQIPANASNNIIWNLGHNVATQQILCYKLANIEMLIPQDFVDLYKKGSSPKQWNQEQNLDVIKNYFALTTANFEIDYLAKKFQNYKPYTTSSGLTLTCIEDALLYNYGHENLHYGVILNLKKQILS